MARVQCSCIRSNKFKSQLLTTSSRLEKCTLVAKLSSDRIFKWMPHLFCRRSRTSYGYNREQKEENWNRHPSEVTQA
ncbi:hypothetical protein EMCRGX_G003354 [Ephydatia muelleri]